MTDNMDCPRVDQNCFLCDKPVIDAWNVGAWNDKGDIICNRNNCWPREQEEWEWITGEGAA